MEAPISHLLAMGPWPDNIPPLCFHFFIHNAEVIAGCNSQDYQEELILQYVEKYFEWYLAQSKHSINIS